MYINVGAPGRSNDSGLFERSSLKIYHEQNDIFKENAKEIDGVNVPVFLIGDSAFRLSDLVLKPFPFATTRSDDQKLFNYRLSKCRRVVENAFGHLKARFRRIGKGLDNPIKNAPLIVKTCCVLHNFLTEERDDVPHRWMEQQAQYEASNHRQQPHEVFGADISVDGNRIREAVTKLLGTYMTKKEHCNFNYLKFYCFLHFCINCLNNSFLSFIKLFFSCTKITLSSLVFSII